MAEVIRLPGAAHGPVHNPSRRAGRYPSNVTSPNSVRQRRDAREARARAQREEAKSDAEVLAACLRVLQRRCAEGRIRAMFIVYKGEDGISWFIPSKWIHEALYGPPSERGEAESELEPEPFTIADACEDLERWGEIVERDELEPRHG